MSRRIGEQTYEVAPGIIVMPIRGANERQDGWQVIDNGYYTQDFRFKSQAVDYAERLHIRHSAERFGDFSRD